MESYKEAELWKKLEEEYQKAGMRSELAEIENLCKDALELMKTARDTFPTYTLHDERHLRNVLDIMGRLLCEEGIQKLSRGEVTMLVLAAFYHDIGMCYSKEQQKMELESLRFEQYLQQNPGEYLKVQESRSQGKEIPEWIKLNYFRKIHHIRTEEMIPGEINISIIRRDCLVKICRSHGEEIEALERIPVDSYYETDYILCGILLRLADVLDFDTTRAPKILYTFSDIGRAEDICADTEWKKHMASGGFRFWQDEKGRRNLAFAAKCEDMQLDHNINMFLDYIDQELYQCGRMLARRGDDRWKKFELPVQVDRSGIQRIGYRQGEYNLMLDAEKVIELLVGNNLYQSPMVFVRELLQNALDAVKARKMVDRRFGKVEAGEEAPEIHIDTWVDEEKNRWFRIDDNGIGMTEKVIADYFLKVGQSYYQSNMFRKDMYDNSKYYEFEPISQFGIGMLSCFLSGDRIEVSTRHWDEGAGIRFSMHGTKGYYSIANEKMGDKGTPMPTSEEKRASCFRRNPGTSIAVRLKKDEWDEYADIESVITGYLCFPDIPVYIKAGKIEKKIPTAAELKAMGESEEKQETYQLSDDILEKVQEFAKKEEVILNPHIYFKMEFFQKLAGTPYIGGIGISIGINGDCEWQVKQECGDWEVIKKIDSQFYAQEHVFGWELDSRCEIRHRNGIYQPSQAEWEKLWQEEKASSDIQAECAKIVEENFQKSSDELAEYIETDTDKQAVKEILRRQKLLFRMQKPGEREKEKHLHIKIPYADYPYIERLMEQYILPRCRKDYGKIYQDYAESAYQGIKISDQTGMEEFPGYSDFSYQVLLWKDKFRPIFGMSREGNMRYPLEAAGYFALLKKKYPRLGVNLGNSSYYAGLSVKDYQKLLEDEGYYEQAMQTFCNNEKRENYKMIQQEFQNGGEPVEISVKSFWDYMDSADDERMRDCFERMILQKSFDVCWRQNKNGWMVMVLEKLRRTEFDENELLFGPLAFAKAEDGNTTILTAEAIFGRVCFNLTHPFSQWLWKNAKYFYEEHRQIFYKILHLLCYGEMREMITGINEILEKISGEGMVEVNSALYLSERAFIRIEW